MRIAQLTVEYAEGTPVMVGIGALRTRDVLQLVEDAQKAGASAVLLSPVSYQRLTEDEAFSLYESVAHSLSVPLCVYDNPVTTHFTFSDELHSRIAQLPQVRSIKIPGVPADAAEAQARVERLRALIPADVTIGVSGDPLAAIGLNAGCDVWYSVLGGLFPKTCLMITRAAQAGDAGAAQRQSALLEPLWLLFRQYGSLRVAATAAELLGWVEGSSLPLPLQTLPSAARRQLREFLDRSELVG
jgi:4-hydroxy-tetrahydrodipicolinate synthase